jgi:hypothetical protein
MQILKCIEERLGTNPYKMVSVTRPQKQVGFHLRKRMHSMLTYADAC